MNKIILIVIVLLSGCAHIHQDGNKPHNLNYKYVNTDIPNSPF